jgi:hypothetical protein
VVIVVAICRRLEPFFWCRVTNQAGTTRLSPIRMAVLTALILGTEGTLLEAETRRIYQP